MTASINAADGKTTLTLKYTAGSARMQALLEGAAQALYAQGQTWWTEDEPPPPFEKLTNAQKLGMISNFVKQSLLAAHRQQLVDSAVGAAKAQAGAQGNIELE